MFGSSSFEKDVVWSCLHDFRQAGPPQRVYCLVPTWEIALSAQQRATASRAERRFCNL